MSLGKRDMQKGIVSITNKDNVCLSRSLVVRIAFKIKDPQYHINDHSKRCWQITT